MDGCNMSKVMLINLPIQTYVQKNFTIDTSYNPALGLLYLSTFLELNGVDVTVLDLCYTRMSLAQLLDLIGETKPILIGISVYTENIEMAVSTARDIKERFPGIKILFGGPHPTLVPDDAIKSEYVDFVIRKEGEPTILELFEAVRSKEAVVKFEDIPGLVFKSNGQVVKNKLRPPISDLDILPIPKRETVDIDKYNAIVNISTSRGCPGACIYCSATALSGASYRTRSVENVLLEMVLIKTLLKEKLQKIYIVDDTFTAIPERIISFTELIKEKGIKIEWHCESRIDIMTEELLDRMADNGCIAIQYGIESGSQQVLDKIRKNINLEQAKRIIDYTYRKNILPCLSFMLGHFCDTKETLEETAQFIEELYMKYKPEMAVSYNTPFPGTWQYENRDELGLKIKVNSYKLFSLLTPVVETGNFTLNDQRYYYNRLVKYTGRLSRLAIIRENMR